MEIRKLSWEDIEKISHDLGQRIQDSNFKPDYLIGIMVGGLIPLALLSKELQINTILTVSASSYEKDKQLELVIRYIPEIDLQGKRILLIDEIAETGDTLRQVSDALIKKNPGIELNTVTLGINAEKCTFKPNFFGIEDTKWIVFPWEKVDFPEYFNS